MTDTPNDRASTMNSELVTEQARLMLGMMERAGLALRQVEVTEKDGVCTVTFTLATSTKVWVSLPTAEFQTLNHEQRRDLVVKCITRVVDAYQDRSTAERRDYARSFIRLVPGTGSAATERSTTSRAGALRLVAQSRNGGSYDK